MLNKIFMTGRLVCDPELKQTPSGTPVTSFCIACDRDFKNGEGEREADFVSIVAWRGTAEFICNNFTKGRLITVVGRLQMRNYTDKDGNKRTATEIVAENIYFADSRPVSHETPPTSDVSDSFAELDDDPDEIPF